MIIVKNNRVCGRYVKALFEIAKENNIIEKVKDDFEVVNKVLKENDSLLKVCASPLVNSQRKLAIINDIFGKHLSKLTLNFLELIVKKGRITSFFSLYVIFNELYKQHNNIKTIILEAAYPPDDDFLNKIKSILTNYTQKTIEFKVEQNTDLIGGFRLRFDDRLYDASLRRKLNLLKKEYEKNIYKRKI